MRCGKTFIFCALLCATFSVRGQSDQERFERQLEQLRLETILGSPQEIPPPQRMLLDYGGYFLFDYLSLEDNQDEHPVLRQSSRLGSAGLNIGRAQEVFLRARAV